MKNIYFLLTLLIVAVSSAGCKRTPVPAAPDGQVQVHFRVSSPGAYVRGATRALTTAQESALKTVHVLVFEGADEASLTLKKMQTRGAGEVALTNGEGEFTVVVNPTASGNYTRLVVLANAAAELEACNIITGTTDPDHPQIADGASYADVRAALWRSAAAKFTGSTGIPMWGESELKQLTTGTTTLSINLLRSLARIDIGVGSHTAASDGTYSWDGKRTENEVSVAIPFKLESVVVMRPQNRLQVMPTASNVESGVAVKPSLATDTELVTAETSAADFAYTDVTTVGEATWLTREIYTPESNVKVTSDGASGDANHLARTAIVVGGKYGSDTETSWYRIDFIREGALVDLLRNHLYLLDIVNVTASGFATPEDAYVRATTNMTVDVVEWNVGPGELWVVGNGFISFEKRALVWEDGNSTAAQSVEIRTNMSGIQLKIGDDVKGSVSATSTTVAWSGTLFDYSWAVAANATGRLTVTPKSAYFDPSATTLAPRSETVKFVINQQEITFTATQNAAISVGGGLPGAGDWGTGGDTQIEN